VLDQEFTAPVETPSNFSSGVTTFFFHALPCSQKPCRFRDRPTFSHASFHNGKTLLQEHVRGDGFQLSILGMRNGKLPGGQIRNEFRPFMGLLPTDDKLMFMLGGRHG
jgi:hypothetical protein